MSAIAAIALTAAERIETLERALDQAAQDIAVARAVAGARQQEIESLRGDLRVAQLLGEFTEQMPHLYVEFEKGEYTLKRTFVKMFTDHRQAMETLRLLRALLNPDAQRIPKGVHS